MKEAERHIKSRKKEITNVSGHCVWILLDDEELALSYSEFPWFKAVTIQ